MMSSLNEKDFSTIYSDDKPPGSRSLSDSSESEESDKSFSDKKIDGNEKLRQYEDGLTVIGVYGKAPIPRKHLLPENHTEKDLSPDQFMPMRKLKTKPISSDEDNISGDEDEYDKTMFVPIRGLVNSSFWHMRQHVEGILEDRAVLFQALEHYEKLNERPEFSSCFENFLETPCFGEQVIVKGYDASQLAIGDVFEVANKLSPLVVEITSPRKPCYYVDKRNGTSMGLKGMKRSTLSEGLAGWFTRVLVAGELRDGMKLVRTKHPNPKWTLVYLSKVLFTGGSKADMMACRASWTQNKGELEELLSIPQLGEFEWKRDAKKLLKKMEKEEEEKEKMAVSRFSKFWGQAEKSSSSSPEVKLTVKGLYGRGYHSDEASTEKHSLMPRERYILSAVGEEKKDGEYLPEFAPVRGMLYEHFWHADDEAVDKNQVYEDRAILFQAIEHYEVLSNDPKFSPCFNNGKYDYLESPTFGEQVIIEGCNSSNIAVGDIFEVEDGLSPLVVEISAPRLPGSYVDRNHHGKVMGEDGIGHHCMKYGLSGWFTRVLVGGTLQDGMKLVRKEHPNPKWTLSYISEAMYSQGETPTWNYDLEELEEMVNLPQLGDFQWKEEGKKLLEEMKRTEKTIEIEQEQRTGFFSNFVSFATGASLCYCEGMETLAGCGTGSLYFE